MTRLCTHSVTFLASLVLGGCASYDYDAFNTAAKRGDCAGAQAQLMPGVSQGDVTAISNMGWLYEFCYHDTNQAAGYYTLAARKGSDYARVQLIRLGRPIPAADLNQQKS